MRSPDVFPCPIVPKSIDWRQPVIDWILAQESTADRPLEPALDALGE